ncbi:G-protein coupled receptor Mth2 [Holothuria leucospilota]|uniref:G-protein coupled receptor Mth2 n=1 Tax=Holothuria leucospilota TaxID=206669 RepID=A0A9Q1H1J0_HOLLE|nr:G-protein coupled receptor Mth2 [Holothuria leucospilota]
MPVRSLVFTKLGLIIVAFVETLTAQNVTLATFVDEWPRPDLTLPPIVISEEEWLPPDFIITPRIMFIPEALCTSVSCTNTWSADYLCRCDDMCEYYGDCCYDVTHATKEFPQSYPTRDLFHCRPLPGLDASTGVNSAPTGYFIVSECPESTSVGMKAQCEEEPDATSYVKAEMFLPVKDEHGFIYKNIYCARCNGVNESSISIWEASHYCSSCPTSLDLHPEHMVQLSSPNCFLSASYQWVTARGCFKGFVNSCPSDFNDTEVITKCQNYLSPGTWNFTWYKNPHCAICNGLIHYLDYSCPRAPTFIIHDNEGGIQDDLFGNLWLLNAVYVEPTITDEENVQEIQRLSQCTKLYPQHLYLAVTIPNHRLQSHSCPYFGKRLEKCVNNQLQRLWINDIELPWRQIVKLPPSDPFATESTLFFHIPPSFTLKPYWESLMAETYAFLMRSKDDCDFQDMYLWRVCGNLSFPEEGIAPCEGLLELNFSDILARISNDEISEFFNPWTMEPLTDVSLYAFKARINGNKIQTYKTEICQVEERRNLTTLKTDIDQFTTSEPSKLKKSRLSPVEQIFSNICIALSITCLLLTFITYCTFPSLRNSFGITLMNFVAAFALGQFLIHFVTDYVTQWGFACTAVAIATHFAWLATFAWMNLLAWNLKSTFDNKKLRAINYTSWKTMLGYFCYGWIVPLCVVSICCTLFFVLSDTIPITYGLIKGVTCWIGNGWVAFSVVIGPLAVTIIVNGVLFVLIVNGIRRSRFRPKDPEEKLPNDRGKTAELLIYIKISLLMGFVWVLGFFISFDKSRILWYTYYTLQALQGFLVMLLFAFNRRVRLLWRSKLRTIKQRSMSSHTRESTI